MILVTKFNSKKKFTFHKINKIIKNYDIVIVSDYGHCFISQKIANFLSKKKMLLSIHN